MLCIYIIIKRHGIIILYLFYGLWMQIWWYPFPSTIGLLSYPIQNDSHAMQDSFEPTINRITFCVQKNIQSNRLLVKKALGLLRDTGSGAPNVIV